MRVVRRRNGLMLDDPAVLFRVVWVRQIQPGWPRWTVAGVKLQPVQLASVGFPAETIDACAASYMQPDEPPAA